MSTVDSAVARADGNWRTAIRGWLALFALGMIGVVAVAATAVPTLRATPGFETLPYPALLALAAVNSTILVFVFTGLGSATAPRIGLRSNVYDWAAGRDPDWAALRESVPLAAGLGAGLFVLVAVLDVAFAPFVSLDQGAVLGDAETLRALASSIPLRLLYGGITEELLLRWGVMAPVAFVLWRLRGVVADATERPGAAVLWTAIVVSAVLFGAGHLPTLAATYTLTPALVVRTVLLNAVVGVGLGWLFWRRSLEAGMVAHASFHVALLVVSALLVVLT